MKHDLFRRSHGKAAHVRWLAVVLVLLIALAPAMAHAIELHGGAQPISIAQQADHDGDQLDDAHVAHCIAHQSGCPGLGPGILPQGATGPELAESRGARADPGLPQGQAGGRMDHPPKTDFRT